MRLMFALLAGGLFGAGLHVSGMTNTTKVLGFLDFFGAWDPTLAFVMGGAIVPMFFAWRYTTNRRPIAGGSFPARPDAKITPPLVVGSTLFGMGWGLVGLCPGPALASLGYGGIGGIIFLASMLAGMIAAPPLRARLDTHAALS
jgi:uncharacterized membrane protein YedE/YeeE